MSAAPANDIMNAAVQDLLATLGPDLVRTGNAIPERNWADQVGLPPQRPIALVLPRTTEDVSKALEICHRHRQPVVTQGGMTGLAGGAHPGEGEVALSLERMVGIEEVDTASNTLTALSGTPLYLIQQAAEEAGLMCGIDLGARGSCSIGGNVATNAGGNQVLRYGMARKNVLGLEVVMADGRVIRSLNKMMKNNAGYDWTQMFIGSEGTLGVITRVVLGLHARPQNIQTAVLAVEGAADAIAVLRAAEKALPGGLLVFEAMWSEFYGIATTTIGVPAPSSAGMTSISSSKPRPARRASRSSRISWPRCTRRGWSRTLSSPSPARSATSSGPCARASTSMASSCPRQWASTCRSR